jgi:hypothetical protein
MADDDERERDDATIVEPGLAERFAQESDGGGARIGRRSGGNRRPGAPQIRKARPPVPDAAEMAPLPQLGAGDSHDEATLVLRSDFATPGSGAFKGAPRPAAGMPHAPAHAHAHAPPRVAPAPSPRAHAPVPAAPARPIAPATASLSPAGAPLPAWVVPYVVAMLALSAGGAVIFYLQLRALGRV